MFNSLYCNNWSSVVCSTVCTVTTGPVWCVQQSLYCNNWSGVVCSTVCTATTGPVWCVQQSVLQKLVRCGVFNRVCTVTTGPMWCVLEVVAKSELVAQKHPNSMGSCNEETYMPSTCMAWKLMVVATSHLHRHRQRWSVSSHRWCF